MEKKIEKKLSYKQMKGAHEKFIQNLKLGYIAGNVVLAANEAAQKEGKEEPTNDHWAMAGENLKTQLRKANYDDFGHYAKPFFFIAALLIQYELLMPALIGTVILRALKDKEVSNLFLIPLTILYCALLLALNSVGWDVERLFKRIF